MTASVSSVLEQRAAAPPAGTMRRPFVVALALHLLPLVAWLWTVLFPPPRPPLEFVAVRIVPAARLGVEAPKPQPSPKPAPAKPEPRPEPVRESTAPVLPEKKPKSKPTPKTESPAPSDTPPVAPQSKVDPAPAEVQGTAGGALSGLALGAPTAMLDNPDFTYGYYVDQMVSLISRNWTRPLVGGGVEAWVHFDIARDGSISGIRIVRSSGINSFDLAALRAVQSTSPLPPLPRAFREDSLGVNLIVR